MKHRKLLVIKPPKIPRKFAPLFWATPNLRALSYAPLMRVLYRSVTKLHIDLTTEERWKIYVLIGI